MSLAPDWTVFDESTAEEAEPASPQERYPTMTAAELAASDIRVEFIIPRVLVAGQAMEIAGPMKSLKTSILVDLALSVSTATPFLREFEVPEAVPVILMSAESGLAKLKSSLHRVAYAAGVALSEVQTLHLTTAVPHFSNIRDIGALEKLVRSLDARLLLIDPAYFCLDGDNQGNLAGQGAQLRTINEMCIAEGVTLVLCHHTQKAHLRTFEPLDLSCISGAGHGEFARQWCLLSRRSAYQHDGRHEMWAVIGGSEGHGGCFALDVDEGHPDDLGGRKWEVAVTTGQEIIQTNREDRRQAQADRQQKEDETAQRRVIEAMSTRLPRGEGVFVATLRTFTGFSEPRLKRLLVMLTDQGIVEGCQALRSPTHKLPQDGAFRLTEKWWAND